MRIDTGARTRYGVVFRHARAQTTGNGFLTRAAARAERLLGKVHRGEVRVSRESRETHWTRYR
jgi:hypothetical protein